VLVNELKHSSSAASIKPITQKNEKLKQVASEIKVYTEDDHHAYASEETWELYEKFRDAILQLADGIEVKPQKFYVALKKDRNVSCLELGKKKMKIFIGMKAGKLDDAKGLAKDVQNIGHYGTGDYQIEVTSDKDLEYIMSLVKQAL